MQRLWRLLCEPALRGLVLCLWLALFSWPFWSETSYRDISFLFPYHLLCWLLLALLLGLMGLALGRRADPGQDAAPEDELDL